MTRHCRLSLATLAAITAALIWASEAAQAATCEVRSEIIAELDADYGETPRGIGMSGQAVVEIWASVTTGTWTILRTTPDGVACALATGEGWTEFGPVLVGDAL